MVRQESVSIRCQGQNKCGRSCGQMVSVDNFPPPSPQSRDSSKIKEHGCVLVEGQFSQGWDLTVNRDICDCHGQSRRCAAGT